MARKRRKKTASQPVPNDQVRDTPAGEEEKQGFHQGSRVRQVTERNR